MFKRNHITTAIVAGGLLIGATAAFAQQSETVQASVSVQNAFNLSQTQALSFGTLRVSQSISGTLDTVPTITINPDGSAPTITASADATGDTGEISVISDGQPAIFSIDSAAPNTAMTISSITSAALTNVASTAGFTVDFVIAEDVEVSSGTNAGQSYTAFNLVTDATGAVDFTLGGTLSTDNTGTDYADVLYSGDYTVTVEY